MSRYINRITDTITIITGIDHALGPFVDITDTRYAANPKDEQGEGYLVEWCLKFGFTTNLIKIKQTELMSERRIKFLINMYLIGIKK